MHSLAKAKSPKEQGLLTALAKNALSPLHTTTPLVHRRIGAQKARAKAKAKSKAQGKGKGLPYLNDKNKAKTTIKKMKNGLNLTFYTYISTRYQLRPFLTTILFL